MTTRSGMEGVWAVGLSRSSGRGMGASRGDGGIFEMTWREGCGCRIYMLEDVAFRGSEGMEMRFVVSVIRCCATHHQANGFAGSSGTDKI